MDTNDIWERCLAKNDFSILRVYLQQHRRPPSTCEHEFPYRHRIRDVDLGSVCIRAYRCISCEGRLFFETVDCALVDLGVPYDLQGSDLLEWAKFDSKFEIKGEVGWAAARLKYNCLYLAEYWEKLVTKAENLEEQECVLVQWVQMIQRSDPSYEALFEITTYFFRVLGEEKLRKLHPIIIDLLPSLPGVSFIDDGILLRLNGQEIVNLQIWLCKCLCLRPTDNSNLIETMSKLARDRALGVARLPCALALSRSTNEIEYLRQIVSEMLEELLQNAAKDLGLEIWGSLYIEAIEAASELIQTNPQVVGQLELLSRHPDPKISNAATVVLTEN